MKAVAESARQVPVIAEVDVLVVGSGPGGLAAAIGAGRRVRAQGQVAAGEAGGDQRQVVAGVGRPQQKQQRDADQHRQLARPARPGDDGDGPGRQRRRGSVSPKAGAASPAAPSEMTARLAWVATGQAAQAPVDRPSASIGALVIRPGP